MAEVYDHLATRVNGAPPRPNGVEETSLVHVTPLGVTSSPAALPSDASWPLCCRSGRTSTRLLRTAAGPARSTAARVCCPPAGRRSREQVRHPHRRRRRGQRRDGVGGAEGLLAGVVAGLGV